MDRVTRTELALHLGVSQPAVTNAIKTGRLQVGDDNKLDLDASLRDWEANASPARRANAPRGKHSKGDAPKPVNRVVPIEAVEATRDVIEADTGVRPTGTMTFAEAKTANEILKAQSAKLKLERMRGSLVQKDGAEKMVFELARQERDSWLQWPARVAAIIAAEVGLDPATLQTQLDRHIREHLAAMVEPAVRLR